MIDRRYILLGSAVIIILLMAAFQFIFLREKTVTTTATEQIITFVGHARAQSPPQNRSEILKVCLGLLTAN